MELHKSLSRQLNRLALNAHILPSDLESWQEFLKYVSNTYLEFDQERYLTARSINISSRELLDLNQKLENAQHIARLGYWFHDTKTGKITLSKELLHLLGNNSENFTQLFEEFIQLIHEEDKKELIELTEKAIYKGISYEKEIRIQQFNGKYRWYYVVGHPLNAKGKNTQLSGIAMDITQRKKAEKEVALLHQRLLTVARQAGMADLATAILHNIGNILNSANVSLNIIRENIDNSYLEKLLAVLELFKKHRDTIAEYLTQDPKGQLIPEYLIEVYDVLKTENNTWVTEISNLSLHLQHIRGILEAQEAFSGMSGMSEKIFLPEVIDIALQMSGYSLFSKEIQVNKLYEKTPFITVDKAKLLQILVNLIRNAKDAVMMDKKEIKKEINFLIQEGQSDKEIVIKISDNGIGIAQENLIKVFSFGFTSKPNGHGIGLNSCSIAAREMGGCLIAESKGIGLGATFTLTIPVNFKKTGEKYGTAA